MKLNDRKKALGIYQLANGNRIKITKIIDEIARDGSKDTIVWFYFTRGGHKDGFKIHDRFHGSTGLILNTFIKYYINEYGAIKV